MKKGRALFVFRRDLRLEDNTGLLFALERFQEVVPAFIFTREQLENNAYRSERCVQFLCESLEDLASALEKKGGRLYLFFGKPEQVIEELIASEGLDGVVVNQDYTPYSRQRDALIEKVCLENGVIFQSCEDLLLHPVSSHVKANGTPYTVFTPYFRKVSLLPVALPRPNRYQNYYARPIASAKPITFLQTVTERKLTLFPGGREACQKMVSHLSSSCVSTGLSPHLKFTTCSSREIYQGIKKKVANPSALLRSLHWRDFFCGIAFYFPHVFQGAFHARWNDMAWDNNEEYFSRWCRGETGFPLVDAGMREMRATGFMNNRLRMVVGSFLVKDLHIDWRWGERYFAQTLVDYDPALNNGNWQWVASTGCDAQPYFRIFNPWLQQKKVDPEAVYIKKWIPELALLSAGEIHQLEGRIARGAYPYPMVEHASEARRALASYYKIAREKEA